MLVLSRHRPGNIGSAFRNAAAFGADGVLLSPTCCDPLYRKAIGPRWAAFCGCYARLQNWPWELATLKAEGFTLVALTPRRAIDLSLCARRQPREDGAWWGGAPDYSRGGILAHVCVRIPVSPAVDR